MKTRTYLLALIIGIVFSTQLKAQTYFLILIDYLVRVHVKKGGSLSWEPSI